MDRGYTITFIIHMKNNPSKRLTALAAGLCLLFSAASTLHAEEEKSEAKKGGKGFGGMVESYDASSGELTVKQKKTDETRTFKVTDETTIAKSDKSEATAEDLASAKNVRVMVGDDDVATKVTIRVPKPKDSDGAKKVKAKDDSGY